LVAFALLVAVTLVVTVWASRRTRSATQFFAAGRSISGPQNGLAIAGDLMSAATFLGFTGAMYLAGFDGWIMPAVTLVAFVLILPLFAERMRNAGRFTVADVLSFRLRERPVRAATATTTVFVAVIYLVAQLVGAGVLIRALTGLSFAPAVIITGAAMLAYVVFGGMLATTWVQIIKACLLMTAGVALSLGVLIATGFDLGVLFATAAANHPAGVEYLARRLRADVPRHRVGGARVRDRHRGAPAHPDPVLHRPGRTAGPLVGGVGDRPDRRVLRDDRDHRVRGEGGAAS
jgi:cation/acetate symporter